MLRPRSLRHRVLFLFAILAVGPLLALGFLDYARARGAVERIIAAQTDTSATRAARLIGDRYNVVESDAILLAENIETQRLFSLLAAGDSVRAVAARSTAESFVQHVWTNARNSYRSLELRNSRGAPVISLIADSVGGDAATDDALPPVEYPIVESGGTRRLGAVVLRPRASYLLPSTLSGLPFGHSGFLVVSDSAGRHLYFDSRRSNVAFAGIEGLGAETLARLLDNLRAHASRPSVLYSDSHSERVASAAPIADARWLVLSSTDINEFTAGLSDVRFIDLSVILAIAAAVAVAFTLLIARTTRSLEELTRAAATVGQGDLAPPLPPAGEDEVGTLSGAFDHMLQRLRTMLREIEISRQLAVLGEFSAQLSHEVRNPLTSLKLNLQGLDRDIRRERLPEHARPAIQTCLREVNRLDRVVRGVLELAKPRASLRGPCGTHALIDDILAMHAEELRSHGISIVREFDAPRDVVVGDQERLVSLFTNLIVNAIDAQPHGGRLLFRTCAAGTSVRVTVADDGEGVRPDLAETIFRPFVSGKSTGTGLGLSMALGIARDHGGSIELVTAPAGFRGAAFDVALPVQ